MGGSDAKPVPDPDPVIKFLKVENYFNLSEKNVCIVDNANDSCLCQLKIGTVPIKEEVDKDIASQEIRMKGETDLGSDTDERIQRIKCYDTKGFPSSADSRKPSHKPCAFVSKYRTIIRPKKEPFDCCDCEKTHVTSGNTNHSRRTRSDEESILTRKPKKPPLSPLTIEKYFTCNECGYKCRKLWMLREHVRSHTREIPAHYRTHTDRENPCMCNICNCRFSSLRSLKMHIVKVHGARNLFNKLECEECGFKTDLSWTMKQHMKTHTEDKPFICKDCDFRTKFQNSMIRHLKTHYRDERYVCQDCGYKTSRADTFKEHVRTHTGEKPFVCDECDYACVQFSNLRRHRRLMHSQKNRYGCKDCDYRTNDPAALKRHYLTAHEGNCSD